MFYYFKDNALEEWAYKKAVTIEAYNDYDPIPVPLNIIYTIGKCLCREEGNSEDTEVNIEIIWNYLMQSFPDIEI